MAPLASLASTSQSRPELKSDIHQLLRLLLFAKLFVRESTSPTGSQVSLPQDPGAAGQQRSKAGQGGMVTVGTRQLQKDLARSEIWQLTNIWLEIAREYMAPPTWLKTQQEKSGSFVSLSSSLSASVYDAGPGSPQSRGQRSNATSGAPARLSINQSINASSHNEKKQTDERRASPRVRNSGGEDLDVELTLAFDDETSEKSAGH